MDRFCAPDYIITLHIDNKFLPSVAAHSFIHTHCLFSYDFTVCVFCTHTTPSHSFGELCVSYLFFYIVVFCEFIVHYASLLLCCFRVVAVVIPNILLGINKALSTLSRRYSPGSDNYALACSIVMGRSPHTRNSPNNQSFSSDTSSSSTHWRQKSNPDG